MEEKIKQYVISRYGFDHGPKNQIRMEKIMAELTVKYREKQRNGIDEDSAFRNAISEFEESEQKEALRRTWVHRAVWNIMLLLSFLFLLLALIVRLTDWEAAWFYSGKLWDVSLVNISFFVTLAFQIVSVVLETAVLVKYKNKMNILFVIIPAGLLVLSGLIMAVMLIG